MNENRILPRSPSVARRLKVADITHFPSELRLTMISLQGIVNQAEPRIYLVQKEYDKQWLEWLVERGDVDELETVGLMDTFGMIRQFRDELNGQVVVDPELPATINVATMIAGLDKLLITSPDYADRYAEQYDLPIVEDLRGRFKTSAEAYEWAWNTLWPKLSHDVLAILHPTILPLRDYLIQHKIFVWWQSGTVDARDPGNSIVDEMRLTLKVLKTSPVNIPILGYPWAGDGIGLGEQPGVTLFSSYGKYLVPTDHAANLSVHSGTKEVPVNLGRLEPDPTSDDAPSTTELKSPDDLTRVYVSYILSDGDNLQAWLHFFRKYWDSPLRGEVPVGWTIGPLALELMPDVLDYLQQTRTPADVFLCAVSGIGYAYLEHYGEALEAPEEARAGFLALTAKYMDSLGIDMIWPMAASGPVSEAMLTEYAQHLPDLVAIFPDYGQRVAGYDQAHLLVTANGRQIPVFHALGSGGTRMVDELTRIVQGSPRPAFVHAFVFNWSHTMEDLVAGAKALEADCKFVRPDELATLYTRFVGQQPPEHSSVRS
ncbi:MAG: hypothetical protein IMX00_07880 [Limnochordales bacterium]|nr:hypothetical protein [Limnochordales bacterium]